jgi:hypothetical protein
MALLAPVFLTGKALFWGTPLLQFVPWWSFAWSTLLDGNLPLWNPLLGMGAPLLANYQSALFYPPTWIYLLLYAIGGTPVLAWGQAPLVSLHLAWAALGFALVIRRLGLGLLPQAVGGLAFGLSGYLVSRASFLSINSTVAWLPWVILCLTPDGRGHWFTKLRFFGLVFFLSMQLLAGHAQTAWYTLLLAAFWTAFWVWNSERRENGAQAGSKGYRRWFYGVKKPALALGWLVLAVTLAFCLAAIQLLPTAEYLAQSQRSGEVEFDFALNYSFWPWRLLTLLAPEMFGSPVRGDFWGYGNYWEDTIYIGLLPFLLAIGVLISNVRATKKVDPARENQDSQDTGWPGVAKYRRLVWFLFLLFLIALLLALGKNTPVFPWLYRHVPTFDMFQAPTRIMIWGVFALSFLAALGAEKWRRPRNRALYWTRLGTAGAFAVCLGAGLAWYMMGEISPTFIRATALLGMWGVGAGLLSLAAPLREQELDLLSDTDREKAGRLGGLWRWAVVALVAADLLVAGWGLNPGTDLSLYQDSPMADQVRAMAGGHRVYMPDVHEQMIKYRRFLRFNTFDPGEDWINLRAVMLPNANMLDGIASTNNFDPLIPGRYAIWMKSLHQVNAQAWRRMLDIMGVGLIEIADRSQPFGVRFVETETAGRLRWVPCARFVSDGAVAWELIAAGEIDFRKVVILETAESLPEMSCPGAADDIGSAQVIVLSSGAGDTGGDIEPGPGQVVVRVNASAPGWLVLSDAWYPGWSARLDGIAVLMLRANYLFRAVYVPAGDHEVGLYYRPVSFWVGLLLSLSSILVIIILVRKISSGGAA